MASLHPLYGAESEDVLLKGLDDARTDPELILLLQKIASMGTGKSEKKLADLLKNSESSKVRSSAAYALGEIKGGISVTSRTALEQAFKIDDKYVREKAIESLAKTGDRSSLPFFLEGYNEKSGMNMKYWALIGIARYGGKEHMTIFTESLNINWEKGGAREAAIEAIGRFGIMNNWALIKSYSTGSEASLVISSLRAAGSLKNPDSLDVIEKQLSHGNSLVAKEALEALGQFGIKYGMPVLIRFKAGNQDNPLVENIKGILKKMNAEKQYAIAKEDINLRSEPTERSNIKKLIRKDSIAVVLKKEPRRYIITDKSGEMEDYWYHVKDDEGHTGFLFGGYLTIVNSYD